MAACLLGYGVIGKQLHADPRSKKEGNLYWTWIENYVGDDYVDAVKTGSGECTGGQSGGCGPWLTLDPELLERHAVLQSPARIEELVKVFIHATKVSRSTNNGCCK
jgi:thiaminase